MSAPQVVLDLTERFDRNRAAYRSGQYKETPLRRDFIDPFFKALGWDIDNEQGHAEAYKNVVHEDTIRVGGQPVIEVYSSLLSHLERIAKILKMTPATSGRLTRKSFADEMVEAEVVD